MANKRACRKVRTIIFPLLSVRFESLYGLGSPEPNIEILIDEINVPLAFNLIYFKFSICSTNIFNFKAFFLRTNLYEISGNHLKSVKPLLS